MYDERFYVFGGIGIIVRDDCLICVHVGFCGIWVVNVWGQVLEMGEFIVWVQVILMVEKCLLGVFIFCFEGDDVELLLVLVIAVIDDGLLWVIGGIFVVVVDGAAFEVCNWVILCWCGVLVNKLLCDGSYKNVGFYDAAS